MLFEMLNKRPMIGSLSRRAEVKPNAGVSLNPTTRTGKLTTVGPLALFDPKPDLLLCHALLSKVGLVQVLGSTDAPDSRNHDGKKQGKLGSQREKDDWDS